MTVTYQVVQHDHSDIALDFLLKNKRTSQLDMNSLKFVDCDYSLCCAGDSNVIEYTVYKFRIQFLMGDRPHEAIVITHHKDGVLGGGYYLTYAMLDGEVDLTKC